MNLSPARGADSPSACPARMGRIAARHCGRFAITARGGPADGESLQAWLGVELVERDEIDKVMREHQLSINGNLGQELNLSKLLRAQGILIMEVTQKDGAAVLHARLAAVEQGVVIFDFDAPLASGKVDSLAPLISSRVVPLLSKLQVERGKAVPISILNLHSLDAGGEALEREVTAMLSSRLALEPAVFVLERRRLNLLANEKTMGEESPGAFWDGAYLLDGNIEAGRGKDRTLTIRLRLRQPRRGKWKSDHRLGRGERDEGADN